MLSLARLSIRRPKGALAAWLAIGVALSVIGFGVASSLSPSISVVRGTESWRAQQLANAKFGPTQLIPILLEGPQTQLNVQGPKLVLALTKRPHTRVLSAWDAGSASATLRPRPTAKLMIVSVDRSEKNVVKYDQPQIERLVSRLVSAPVNAYVTGQPSLDRAIKAASIDNLRTTELIAVGVLFVLLLVGLRAPIAALVVTAVGAISMLAGFGEVAILGKLLKLDPVGVALGTMTGLALGVAFALLILDRFHREELPPGAAPRDAGTAAVRELATTGRAVLVGGTAMILALALVAIIGPTELMVSLGTGMLTCAAFATGGAVVVMPAALVLLGRRIDAFSFPAPASLARAWSELVSGGNWVTRHAVYTGLAATVLLAALAVPAFALKTGPPDPSQLPKDAKARIAFEEVSRVMGPGWPWVYNLVVVPRNRAVTDPAVLAKLSKFEKQIAAIGAVSTVAGPGEIFNPSANDLKAFGPSLAKSAKVSNQSKRDLLKLIDGLGQAGAGSQQLQTGLQQASSGASQLHTGSGQAQSGAGALHSGSVQLHAGSAKLTAGLAQARAGSAQLSSGLSQALAGASALKSGSAQALSGSSKLAQGITQAHAGAGQSIVALNGLSSLTASTSAAAAGAHTSAQSAASDLAAAQTALSSMTTGKSDPQYGTAADALARASTAAGRASTQAGAAAGTAAQTSALAAAVAKQAPALVNGLSQLQTGAGQLESGIRQLRDGNAQLATGIGQLSGGGTQLNSGLGQLSGGGTQLTSGLSQLTDGAGKLEAGLAQLTGGTGQLASGLVGGVGPAGQLVTGLGVMQAAVVKARGQIPSTKDLEKLQKQSPGLFSSGYFVLAAIEGAQPADRNAATFSINLLQGGTAGQILVYPKYPANDRRTAALRTRLSALGQTFARQNNAQVALGGPAGNLGDLTSLTKSRIPLAIAGLALALALVLALAVRALLLPAVAIAFSLLVAAASFGVLQLLFGGSNPPLGGPGYLDPMSTLGIFTVAFGISVVFAALLLMRTREAYVAGERSTEAVRVGLRQTAAAATGAGLVMIAALIPFAFSGLINVRQFGIGVAVAVLLDVVLFRPVLLPAAEAVLGRAGWWPTKQPRAAGPEPRPARRRPHLPHARPRAAQR